MQHSTWPHLLLVSWSCTLQYWEGTALKENHHWGWKTEWKHSSCFSEGDIEGEGVTCCLLFLMGPPAAEVRANTSCQYRALIFRPGTTYLLFKRCFGVWGVMGRQGWRTVPASQLLAVQDWPDFPFDDPVSSLLDYLGLYLPHPGCQMLWNPGLSPALSNGPFFFFLIWSQFSTIFSLICFPGNN
jgi:hypothetical protein